MHTIIVALAVSTYVWSIAEVIKEEFSPWLCVVLCTIMVLSVFAAIRYDDIKFLWGE